MARRKLYEDLRPASFRGVSFQVDVASLSAGRRVQVHEYPQRDQPWVEDLGRATRQGVACRVCQHQSPVSKPLSITAYAPSSLRVSAMS